ADEKGVVKFNGLHAGNYTIKETKALDFYVISDGTYKFTVNPDGSCDFKPQGPEDIFINKLKDETTNVSFVKKGSDGMFLAGTEFTLTGKLSNGKAFADITAIADANGVVKFNDLHAGDYSLKETKALPFYQISTKEYKFKVAPNGETNFSVEVETLFVNARKDIAFDFTFTKLDGEGNALAGAEFALENENGEKTVVTSDESGSVSFGNLHEGVYTLTETKAPTGYAISEAIIKLKVNPDGTILNANDQPLSILDITNEMVNYLEEIITPPETPIAPPPNGDNEKPTPPEEEINPNDVPMAEPPKTSDSTTLLTVALILAGISLSVIIARKKFVED
ncbi:MAG: SpaA isopeptide-forming pilin-related protein, partial [Oscillospiraceae bacterium]